MGFTYMYSFYPYSLVYNMDITHDKPGMLCLAQTSRVAMAELECGFSLWLQIEKEGLQQMKVYRMIQPIMPQSPNVTKNKATVLEW